MRHFTASMPLCEVRRVPVTNRLSAFLYALIVALLICAPAQALHSPAEWYEHSSLDADGNKLDDFLDDHEIVELLDVFVCFKFDCLPDNRMQELDDLADIGYVSPVLACVQVRNIPLGDLQSIVATWPEVGYICPNEPVEYHMSTAGEALKAHAGLYSPTTIEDQGVDGTGITIAIVDCGVDDLGHPDLPPAVGGLIMLDGITGQLTPGNPTDDNGHGTRVAGAALGRGSAGANRGTAPGASLFDARIEDSTGATSSAAVLAILDWIHQNHATVTPRIKVVNLSLGSNRASNGFHPVTQAINNLSFRGISVVAAGGNHGSCDTTVTFPSTGMSYPAGFGYVAVASTAITVAAADHQGTVDRSDDVIASFSRVGPGLGTVPKPDLTAYGGGCTLPRCPQGGCAGGANDAIVSTDSSGGYSAAVGTSIAAPQVSGIIACYYEARPNVWPTGVRNFLRNNAEDFGPPGWDSLWGMGIIDIANIQGLGQPIPPTPCNLEVWGVAYYPQPVVCGQQTTISVWVHNAGIVPADSFTVDVERYYFGPNNAPAQLFKVIDTPMVNTQGPLLPDSFRVFQAYWTPGVSDSLPLSQHSCFWGIVNAPCDAFPNNDRRNTNFTITGLVNNQCGPPSPAPSPVVKSGVPGNPEEPVVIRMRLAHDQPGDLLVNVFVENPDPDNWQVELVAPDGTSGPLLTLPVNMSDCAVWVDLVASRFDPSHELPVELLVIMDNSDFGVLGEAQVLIDPNLANSCCEGLRGNVDGLGDPSTPTLGDLTVMIDHLFISLEPLNCWEEANMDGSLPEGEGSVTLGDLTLMIDNLFISLEPPIPCP